MLTLREREVSACEREAETRLLETQAISEKTRKETALLSTKERVKITCKRKQFIDDGICTAEDIIDIIFLNSLLVHVRFFNLTQIK